MSFSHIKYKRACKDYVANWEAIELALYNLCKRHPDHQSQGSINAKLWIIGRTYATGIERKISSQGSQGSSMTQLGEHFWRNRHQIDKVLGDLDLRKVNEPLTPRKLTRILDAHGRMAGIVQGVLREGQTPRSFVSKYLHFHNPAVPIFDSVAVAALRKEYRRARPDGSFEIPATADPQYADFLIRFWRLYQDACASGEKVTVKLLDNYLLALAKDAK